MQNMYEISFSIIILKMSILEENVSKVWAETAATAPWTTLSGEFYELTFHFSKLWERGPPFSIEYFKLTMKMSVHRNEGRRDLTSLCDVTGCQRTDDAGAVVGCSSSS